MKSITVAVLAALAAAAPALAHPFPASRAGVHGAAPGHVAAAHGVHGTQHHVGFGAPHRDRGFGWGWGGPWLTGPVPEAIEGVDEGALPRRDVPLVDFYNAPLYSGGPYASPVGPAPPPWAVDTAVPAGMPVSPACSMQTVAVPGAQVPGHGVTIVRC